MTAEAALAPPALDAPEPYMSSPPQPGEESAAFKKMTLPATGTEASPLPPPLRRAEPAPRLGWLWDAGIIGLGLTYLVAMLL